LLEVEARGTKGHVAGGGGYGDQRTSCWRRRLGLPKDKLLEVESKGTKGQVAGGGGEGYQRTSCWGC